MAPATLASRWLLSERLYYSCSSDFVSTFWSFAALLAAWCVLFIVFAKDAPRTAAPKSFVQMVQPLNEQMSWVLSFFYFLTFGGFVAMSICLPMFLTELFKLTPQDAGFRTAGFVLLATAMRPIGGWLSDKVGGLTILIRIFPFVTAMALLLTLKPWFHSQSALWAWLLPSGWEMVLCSNWYRSTFLSPWAQSPDWWEPWEVWEDFFRPGAGAHPAANRIFLLGFGLLALFALLCLVLAKITARRQIKLTHRDV